MTTQDAPPEPRSRDNRLRRDRITSPSVGPEDFKVTCPRCGWPCKYINIVCWDSEWNALGGLCGQCCQDASAHFDLVGWPPLRPDFDEPLQPRTPEPSKDPVAEAAAGRDAGMTAVDEATDERWKAHARDALATLARRGEPFIGDDVWDVLEAAGVAEPANLRALGPIMQQASTNGLIQRTGGSRKSVRSHLAEKPEWIGVPQPEVEAQPEPEVKSLANAPIGSPVTILPNDENGVAIEPDPEPVPEIEPEPDPEPEGPEPVPDEPSAILDERVWREAASAILDERAGTQEPFLIADVLVEVNDKTRMDGTMKILVDVLRDKVADGRIIRCNDGKEVGVNTTVVQWRGV